MNLSFSIDFWWTIHNENHFFWNIWNRSPWPSPELVCILEDVSPWLSCYPILWLFICLVGMQSTIHGGIFIWHKRSLLKLKVSNNHLPKKVRNSQRPPLGTTHFRLRGPSSWSPAKFKPPLKKNGISKLVVWRSQKFAKKRVIKPPPIGGSQLIPTRWAPMIVINGVITLANGRK